MIFRLLQDLMCTSYMGTQKKYDPGLTSSQEVAIEAGRLEVGEQGFN